MKKSPPLIRLLRALPGDIGPAADSLSAEEWEALPVDAERHGLSGLFVDALAPRQARGERWLTTLRAQARNAAANAMKLHRLLLDSLALLQKRDIAPVLMKGWGFGARYWPDPLLRPASDVDLLVEPASLDVVERCMTSLGLVRSVDAGMDDVEEEHHHIAYAGPRGLVEVHFRLLIGFGGATFGDEAVFKRCREATLENFPVRYLAPEDELVYLASHAAQHLFLRVAWLHDLKLLVGGSRFEVRGSRDLDWDRVVRTARESKLRAATHAALVLAHDALDADIPQDVLRALAPTRLHAKAVRRAFTDEALVSAKLATGKASSALRATLSDTPVRAARHLAEGALRNVRRRVRVGKLS